MQEWCLIELGLCRLRNIPSSFMKLPREAVREGLRESQAGARAALDWPGG